MPVIVISGLSETARRGLALADNKLALNSGWDIDILTQELAFLSDMKGDFDFTVTGFETGEIDNLLAAADESGANGDEDRCPAPLKNAVSRSGDRGSNAACPLNSIVMVEEMPFCPKIPPPATPLHRTLATPLPQDRSFAYPASVLQSACTGEPVLPRTGSRHVGRSGEAGRAPGADGEKWSGSAGAAAERPCG